ncbi:MAG: hypothetical protein WAM14_13055 [Candidatus Nitrosopolaris sp.]
MMIKQFGLNSKRTMVLSTLAIAAVVLLFASGPIVGNQQALASYHGHHYYYHHHYRHYNHHRYHGHYRR